MSFESIPILDLSLVRHADTKSTFLESLRHALLEVGFLYIKNTGIRDDLIEAAITQGKAFFDLPNAKKLEVQMKNAPSFLGRALPYTGKISKLNDPRLQHIGQRNNGVQDGLVRATYRNTPRIYTD